MDQIRQYTLRIYLVTGLSILLVATTFYFVGLSPLVDRLRSEHVREIDHFADSSLWLLQGVLGKHRDLAAQSASRTAIRKKQVAYLRDKVSFQELVNFSEPKLKDAVVANEEIIGITRYDPDGRKLFSVGQDIPLDLAENCLRNELQEVLLIGRVQVNDEPRLQYCSPIDDRDAGRVGIDILLIDDAEIWRIVDDQAGPESNAILAVSDEDNQIVYWPRFKADSPVRGVLHAYLNSEKIDPNYIIESRELKFGDWRIFAMVDQQDFFGEIDRQFRVLLLVGLLVTIVIFALTVAVLRPVIRAMLNVEQLRESATRDGLTGLFNHSIMKELLDLELARLHRNGKPLSLMMLDIDYFKKFNDDYGHQAGDQVLQELSRCIEKLVRKTDKFARYGGEEFMLILPETSHKNALMLAERVRAGVAEMEVETSHGPLKLTISIGVASFNGREALYERHQVIELVDGALYTSKNEGRNRVTGVELNAV